jgi:hypothetical protein
MAREEALEVKGLVLAELAQGLVPALAELAQGVVLAALVPVVQE